MKSRLFHTDPVPASRLLLLFAGWGMDHNPFTRLKVSGYDLCVVWDYRDDRLSFEIAPERYDEIAVVAWSFGVPAAARFIASHPELPFTTKIAINGTQHPVDDRMGIPVGIFRGTLDGLNEKSLQKFYLRMAGSGEAYKAFATTLPERQITELKEELMAVETNDSPIITWDKAIISASDRIIPPANQFNAWENEAFEICSYEGAHLPAFPTLLPSLLTDKSLVKRRFHRAASTYDSNAIIQQRIARNLMDLWTADSAKPLDILEIGCGTGYSTRLICNNCNITTLRLWDLTISDSFVEEFSRLGADIESCDAETEIRNLPSESIDAIITTSTVQWFNSLPSFLLQVERVLRPGGQAVISTFGPDTMREINATMGRESLYPDIDTLHRMIPGGMIIGHLSSTTMHLTFPTPMDVLRHVRLTGVNATTPAASAAETRAFLRSYPTLPDSTAPLTYQPIYMILTKQNQS
ncbi:MAG: DUF452 family protein [Muribaculaceae bacterium]|nr:DUF452 family protein [Muribaculaceae bacterium]